jgi:hypothetical protein
MSFWGKGVNPSYTPCAESSGSSHFFDTGRNPLRFKLISYLKRLVLSHRIQMGYYFSLKVLVVNNTDSYTVDRTIKG